MWEWRLVFDRKNKKDVIIRNLGKFVLNNTLVMLLAFAYKYNVQVVNDEEGDAGSVALGIPS